MRSTLLLKAALLSLAVCAQAVNARSLLAVPDQSLLPWGRMTAGVEFDCAVDYDGNGYCMGHNFDGQLGTGDLKSYNVPTPVKGNIKWQTITAGDWASCGLAVGGDAYCWGYNADGRCGTGNNKSPLKTPQKVVGGIKWRQISTGFFYACGLRIDGAMFCWGKDNYGRLGTGKITKNNYNTPQRVGKDKDWEYVRAGGDHTCAMKKDNTVWCWGSNEKGALGQGKTYKELKYSAVPLQVKGKYKQMTSNGRFACAIKASDSSAVCWGQNLWGQLGNGKSGNNTDSYGPTKVKFPGKWIELAAGQFITCGIQSGGPGKQNRGYCWGAGYTSPERMMPDGWITMSAGDWGGNGVNANGTGFAFWENEWGEGGVGSNKYLKKPTAMKPGPIWGRSGPATPSPEPSPAPAPKP